MIRIETDTPTGFTKKRQGDYIYISLPQAVSLYNGGLLELIKQQAQYLDKDIERAESNRTELLQVKRMLTDLSIL